ncbi:MAG: 4-(cytidine 5'-diphospho)-2-C-methyl-D-erythritol kinase [Acetobacteraceae bacterium]
MPPELPAAEQAPAKVNLYLHITGRRPDSYHILDSMVVFADIGDTLCVREAPELRLAMSGPFATNLAAGADNLVVRAARTLATAAGIKRGASLSLAKMLPHAAGLGGGSADAGATLRLLGRFWKVPEQRVALLPLAASLGADVPACLGSVPARTSGAGEVLGPAPLLPAFGLCLVNPGTRLPTRDVFAAWSGHFSNPAQLPTGWRDAASLATSLALFRNDLEAPAIRLCSSISTVLKVLSAEPGCLLARMTGSGATCFGLFPDATTARRAAVRISRTNWWCWGGGLAEPASTQHGGGSTPSTPTRC